jgi:hypothetical protein
MNKVFEFFSKNAFRQFIGAIIFTFGGSILVATVCNIIKMLVIR